MKTIIRSLAINIFALWAVQEVISGFRIAGGAQNLILVAGALTLLDTFAKPILKILFLPINIATMGLFSWVINVLIIYGLDYFFAEVTISPWTFPGFAYEGFNIPEISFGIIGTYIISAFFISFLSSFLKWL